MKTLNTVLKSAFRTSVQSTLVLGLLVLTACTKEVQKVNHKTEDNTQLLRTIEEQGLEGELASFEISFDRATDASLRAMAKGEGAMETKVLAMRAQLDGILANAANVEVKGNLRVLKASAQEQFDSKDLYESLILPYAQFVLNPKFVENTLYTGDDRYRRMLDTFNRALVILIESNPAYVAETKVLDLYWWAMSRTCAPSSKDPFEMRGTICRTALRYFDTDRNTSSILQYYANSLLPRLRKAYEALEQLEQLATGADLEARDAALANLEKGKKVYSEIVVAYYRVVQFSLKSRNASISSNDSSDLADVLYLKGSFYLEKYFSMQEQTATLRQVRSFYNNDFGAILSRAKEKIDDPVYRNEFRDIIATANFWMNYSRRSLDTEGWVGEMFELASDYRMRDAECEAKDGSQQACLKLAAEKALTQSDVAGQVGLFRMVEEMKSVKDGLALIENLNIETDFAVTDTTYLVDQLFRGHWSVNEAANYFAGMRPNRAVKQQLFTDAEKYLKFRLAKMIRRTNEFMGGVFSDKDEKSTSKEKFRTAIEESQRLTTEWNSLKDQLRNLEKFVHQVGRDSDSDSELQEFKRLERIFDNLEKNINLLAVYPNMLVLAFFAAVENFNMVIRVWWFEFSLDATVIINWLFAQISSNPPRPWFDWGTDPADAKILKFENLYSVYYALKTNTFETIDEALKKAGTEKEITATEFFKVMIERFLNHNRIFIKDFIDDQERAYSNNANYDNSLEMCREEKKAMEIDGYKPRYVKQKLTLDYVGIKTLVPWHTWSESNAKPVFGFYHENANNQLKHVNGFLAHKLTFLNVMIDLLNKHWEEQLKKLPEGSDERVALAAKQEADMKEIRDGFDEINELKRRLYLHVLGTYRETRDCLEVLFGLERHQQWQVFGLLGKHFRKVHAMMAEVQAIGDRKPVLSDLAEGETRPTDEAEAQRIWESELNMKLAEVNQELRADVDLVLYKDEKGNVDANGSPINYYDEIRYENDSAVYVGAKWDAYVRIANWIEKYINDQVEIERPPREILTSDYDLYTDAHQRSKKTTLKYRADVEGFVDAGLREYENKFFEYTSKDWNLAPLETRLTMTFELMKANEFNTYDEAFASYEYDCVSAEAAERSGTEPGCKTGLPYSEVSRREMIMDIIKIAEYLNINSTDAVYSTGMTDASGAEVRETEESIMRRLGMSRKFDLVSGFSFYGGKKSLFLETSSRRPLPIFDTYFKDFVLKGSGFLDEAKTLVITLESLGRENEEGAIAGSENSGEGDELAGKQKLDELIFLSEEDEIRRTSYDYYGKKVEGEFGVMLGVAKEMRALQVEDKQENRERQYLYEINPENSNLEASRSWIRAEKNSNGEPIYIDQVRLGDLDTEINNFHRETRSRFKKAE